KRLNAAIGWRKRVATIAGARQNFANHLRIDDVRVLGVDTHRAGIADAQAHPRKPIAAPPIEAIIDASAVDHLGIGRMQCNGLELHGSQVAVEVRPAMRAPVVSPHATIVAYRVTSQRIETGSAIVFMLDDRPIEMDVAPGGAAIDAERRGILELVIAEIDDR